MRRSGQAHEHVILLLWGTMAAMRTITTKPFESARFTTQPDAAFGLTEHVLDSPHFSVCSQSLCTMCAPPMRAAGMTRAVANYMPPQQTNGITYPDATELLSVGPFAITRDASPALHSPHMKSFLLRQAKAIAGTLFGGLGKWGAKSAVESSPASFDVPLPVPTNHIGSKGRTMVRVIGVLVQAHSSGCAEPCRCHIFGLRGGGGGRVCVRGHTTGHCRDIPATEDKLVFATMIPPNTPQNSVVQLFSTAPMTVWFATCAYVVSATCCCPG